ncbi:MAG TPA: hypothetical protein VK763_15120 [Terriglobales bacterium]|jgi:hypothetical protein|nr:hypothetical protein [Terriglobales bacterium]
MITTVVALLIAVIPAIFVAESVAKRRRVAKWKHSHVNIGDDEFVASVGSVSVPRDAVIRVRQEIARATRLPVNLISASAPIRELEMVSNGSHREILDYFTDLLPVAPPKDDSALMTVQDFVIEFGPQLT